MKRLTLALACVLFSACGKSSLFPRATDALTSSPTEAETSCPAPVVTHGQVTTASAGALTYTATAGAMPIYAQGTQAGAVHACMYYFAYTRDDKAGNTAWPVSFLFNGGPGSASDWIHLGGNGPKTMNFGTEGLDASSAKVSDDPNTMLANSDLVFIDPIGTGYSTTLTGYNQTDYNGLDQDADSIGDFIQGYINDNTRSASPKYLVGESYAGMRIPVLGRYLDEKLSIKLTGMMMISPWLDAIGDDYTDIADDLPYITYLPEFATTSWYFKKLSADLQAQTVEQVYAEAQEFANGPYLEALAAGDDATPDQIATAQAGLAQFTGLSSDIVNASNLRINLDVYRVDVLKATNEVVSYYDGRMASTVKDPTQDDPFDAFNAPFATADNAYFKGTLGIVSNLAYAENDYTSWPGANPGDQIQGGYLNVLGDLTTLMTNNPNLKVAVAGGLYDLTCPPAEVTFMLDHLDEAVTSRIAVHHYHSGHPVYFGTESHTLFAADMATLINGK